MNAHLHNIKLWRIVFYTKQNEGPDRSAAHYMQLAWNDSLNSRFDCSSAVYTTIWRRKQQKLYQTKIQIILILG